MYGLSAVDVMQHYGVDLNVILSSSGQLVVNPEIERTKQQLRTKLRNKVKERAAARARGASPVFCKRDSNYVECTRIDEWLVNTGCGHDLESKSDVALLKNSTPQRRRSPEHSTLQWERQ